MTAQAMAGWILVTLYAATIIVLVVRGARRNRSVADYAVGNIAFSPLAVGLALAASTTSAATFIINPGFVAYFGLPALFGNRVRRQLWPTQASGIALNQHAARGLDIAHQGVERMDGHGGVQAVDATIEEPTLAGHHCHRGLVRGELTREPGNGTGRYSGHLRNGRRLVIFQY